MGKPSLAETKQILTETFRHYSADRVPLLAAALSFYTMLSLAPLVLIAITVAGLMFGEQVAREHVYAEIQRSIGTDAAEAVQELVTGAASSQTETFSALLGIVALVIGASAVFSQLKSALNAIWGVRPGSESESLKPGIGYAIRIWILRKLLSFALVFGTGILLLVSLVASSGVTVALSFVDSITPMQVAAVQIGDVLVSITLTTVLFALLFKFIPDAKVRWREVRTGALVTSVLFNAGKYAISFYLGKSAISANFGAAGSLVVVLLWVYYACQIVFFGAELTQVLSRRDRDVSPDPGNSKPAATEFSTRT